jgi:uncharacterized membrane protein
MDMRGRHRLRSLYDIGLVVKAIESAFDIVAGIAVLFVSRVFVMNIVWLATAGELAQDPSDFVANHLRTAAHTFAVHAHFVLAAYLLIRGVLKLGLIVLILRGVWYAYPLFVVVLGFFASYEAYTAVLNTNYWLGVVALFDTALILFTAYEYNRKDFAPS